MDKIEEEVRRVLLKEGWSKEQVEDYLRKPKPSGRLLTDVELKEWILERTGCTYLFDGHRGVLLDLIAKTAAIVEIKADHEGYLRGYAQAEQSQTARIEALTQDESLDRLTYLGDEYTTKDGRPLVDEVVLSNATIHLESLSDQDFMLIVDNDKYHWHLVICAGSRRSKIYAVVMEEENKATHLKGEEG